MQTVVLYCKCERTGLRGWGGRKWKNRKYGGGGGGDVNGKTESTGGGGGGFAGGGGGEENEVGPLRQLTAEPCIMKIIIMHYLAAEPCNMKMCIRTGISRPRYVMAV